MAAKRIGILTGGGDVPGLNSVIKTVVYRGSEIGCEVIGIRRGWEGLTHVNLEDPASRDALHPAAEPREHPHHRPHRRHLPAQLAHQPLEDEEAPARCWRARTSRKANPPRRASRPPSTTSPSAVLKNIETLGLDYLIAIGGDDTLSYAAELDRQGMKVIAVPKTMDNDVRNTEYCIGFSTAITRAMDAIERQRTTVGSHERIGIFRVFGRDAGYTALYTAYVTSIRCCIPEYKVDLEKLIELLVNDKQQQPQQLLAGGPLRRRRVGRLQGEGVRRAGRLRPPQEDERGRRPEQRDQSRHRRRDHRQRPDLRPALRQPGFRGQHGGLHLRRHGHGLPSRPASTA